MSEQVFFARVYLCERAAHLSVTIKAQINEGQMNEGQRERRGRRTQIKTDLLFASVARAGLHVLMWRFRSYLNKQYVLRSG